MSDRKSEREKVAARIKALLEKTVENGCSEGEAIAAAMKARELADKYQIDLSAADLEAEGGLHGICDPHLGRMVNVQKFMGNGIADFTDTKCWYGECNIAEDGEPPEFDKRLQFVGLASDVDFAFWLVITLEDFVWAQADRFGGNGRERKDFAIGCASRISERLREEAAKRKADASNDSRNALVVVKNALVESTFKELGIKLRNGTSRSRIGSRNAFAAGKQAGNKANFGRPVNGGGGMARLTAN